MSEIDNLFLKLIKEAIAKTKKCKDNLDEEKRKNDPQEKYVIVIKIIC